MDGLSQLPGPIIAAGSRRVHQNRFSDLELTGDARLGAIVEARAYDDANTRLRAITVEPMVLGRGCGDVT